MKFGYRKYALKPELFKKEGPSRTISCPHCGKEQSIPEQIVSTYCASCHRVIDLKKAAPKTPAPAPQVNQKAPPPPRKEKEKEMEKEEEKEKPKPPAESGMRNILCPHCRTWNGVPLIALSSFCSGCNRKINFQDYKIEDRFRGELETQGRLTIGPTGRVSGTIRVYNLLLEGEFRGEVFAFGKVEMGRTARFQGSIRAPKLIVAEGAVLEADLEIRESVLEKDA